MRTPVCDQLGIEFPILAFSHCRDVVAAVSRAGGMGVLGAVAFSPEQLEIELDWIDEHVGGKPYGVDLLVPATYVGSEEGGFDGSKLGEMIPEEHKRFVNGLLEKYGVPPLDEQEQGYFRRTGTGLLSWSHKGAQPLLDIALARPGVRLMVNALGPAPDFMVEGAHRNDKLCAGLVGKKVHAERQAQAGVDIIVAQGYEAGGHTGEVATMVLVPEVVDAVGDIPVLAAGGIATGRQIAASMALGAQGVWCGSVWLTTEEAETHPVVKEKFLAATSSDTVRSRASTGKPARQLRSAWTDEWADPANPDPLAMPLHGMLIAEAQTRISRAAASNPGAKDLVNYFVGQAVGQMNQVKPAAQVVMDMVEEFIVATERMSGLLEG
jgi:NAD(P)H-dependent flavin oxidoreductase YrpB (nitropropane dioxygenase family)